MIKQATEWILRKRFAFEASHQLMHHDGKCANLHGHSWKGSIRVVGFGLQPDGPKQNMLIDYSDLGAITKAIEAKYDHKHLNDVLQSEMPTSELLTQMIYTEIRDKIHGAVLVSVTISETDGTECEYGEDA